MRAWRLGDVTVRLSPGTSVLLEQVITALPDIVQATGLLARCLPFTASNKRVCQAKLNYDPLIKGKLLLRGGTFGASVNENLSTVFSISCQLS